VKDTSHVTRPAIKVELCDNTGTWVTYSTIYSSSIYSILDVVGQTFAMFIANLVRDEPAVIKHISEFQA
jgi:Na+/H+ antiporter NhaA